MYCKYSRYEPSTTLFHKNTTYGSLCQWYTIFCHTPFGILYFKFYVIIKNYLTINLSKHVFFFFFYEAEMSFANKIEFRSKKAEVSHSSAYKSLSLFVSFESSTAKLATAQLCKMWTSCISRLCLSYVSTPLMQPACL